MRYRLVLSVITLFAVSQAYADAFNPSGTYTGKSVMTDVKEIGSPIICQGNIGVPYQVRFTVKTKNGKVTVRDSSTVVRRGTVLPGSRFKAKATVNDGYYKWTYSLTGTKITRTKGTITEIVKRTLLTDPLHRGCQYTYYARNLARKK